MNRLILIIVIILGIVLNEFYVVNSYQSKLAHRLIKYPNKTINDNRKKVLVLNDKDKRKIIGRDNLGDPIYEGDLNTSEGINVFGKKVDVDPLTSSLLIFGLIAFNFFVLANL